MFIRIIEIITVFFVVGFIATQMLWPALTGGTLFPLFKKAGKLEGDLAVAKQEVHDAQLEKEVEQVRKEAEAVKNGTDKV